MRNVTNHITFAYAHEKVNILLSVLSIVVFFFFDGFNQNTQGFVYLEFVGYQLGLHSFREMQCLHICYTVVVLAFFLYRNKSYIFPIVRLTKIEYFNPY